MKKGNKHHFNIMHQLMIYVVFSIFITVFVMMPWTNENIKREGYLGYNNYFSNYNQPLLTDYYPYPSYAIRETIRETPALGYIYKTDYNGAIPIAQIPVANLTRDQPPYPILLNYFPY